MIKNKDNLLGQNSEIKNLKDNKQSQEELVEDLQSSLQNILSETSDLLKELTTTMENSIMDEEIRIESKKIISQISTDVSKALSSTLHKISHANNNDQKQTHYKVNSEEE